MPHNRWFFVGFQQIMWFKNLALLRFTEAFTLSGAELEALLEQRRFSPCGSLEPVSAGWFPPLGKEHFPLVHQSGGFIMLCLQKEEKILPAAAINDIVAERVEQIEATEARPVRRKEREGIRDEVMQDMLPRAFSHTRRTYGYIDVRGGWLVVDSASARKTEDFVALLRQAVGSLPVKPLVTCERPGAIMTHWLASGELPPDVTLESECELRSPEEDGGIVRCRRHDLEAPEIQNHLEAGKEVIKLSISWNDRLSLVLDEALSVKRLRFLDLVQEAAADVETDDPAQRFDLDFSIMSLEIAAFVPVLTAMFGGEPSQSK
jgi:recombination associated protein RdgC